MKIVGLTGGIGSGKTTIAAFFKEFGISVYNADTEAKILMSNSNEIKRKLISLLGDKSYNNGTLNRNYIRSLIFEDDSLLQKINSIVHPEVAKHFKTWVQVQDSPYVLKEAAIIFENNLQNEYDFIITVVADENERIKRVLKREGVTEESIKAIIEKQWSDDKKSKFSDYIIYNNDLISAKAQAYKIHLEILENINFPEF